MPLKVKFEKCEWKINLGAVKPGTPFIHNDELWISGLYFHLNHPKNESSLIPVMHPKTGQIREFSPGLLVETREDMLIVEPSLLKESPDE